MKYKLKDTNEMIIRDQSNAIIRHVAKQNWGDVVSQRKYRRAPYPTWWLTCEAHGGYIVVVDADKEQPFKGWTPAQILTRQDGKEICYVYLFEEDCAWAVLESYWEELALENYQRYIKNTAEPKVATFAAYMEEVERTALRWHADAL